MRIGIPREIKAQENRVSVIPGPVAEKISRTSATRLLPPPLTEAEIICPGSSSSPSI